MRPALRLRALEGPPVPADDRGIVGEGLRAILDSKWEPFRNVETKNEP